MCHLRPFLSYVSELLLLSVLAFMLILSFAFVCSYFPAQFIRCDLILPLEDYKLSGERSVKACT